MTERSGLAKLRPRARLIGLIGEDLISDEPVAVVELVKNSYDADATHVMVEFSGEANTRLVVEDDGHGMNLDTVISSWFEPGTLSKRHDDRSPQGRIYQGAKGIGRFASARLATSLALESRTGQQSPGVTVLFEWGQFEEESYLDEIEVAWEEDTSIDLVRGTRLTLDGLRKEWTEADYEELHSRLSRLISPFGEIADFCITLTVPGFPQWSGVVQPPELLTLPRYQLNGTIDSDGFFDGVLKHDGQEVKRFERTRLGNTGELPTCGPFSTEIRVWDRDREGLDPLATKLNQSISEVRRTLNTYSGVSIYRDGFRVYPYGQRGNDWLNLDNRSRQNPVMRLANNQIVAAIQISRDTNPDLRDRSTREGLVLNEAYNALDRWFKEVLQEIETYRYGVRPRRQPEPAKEPLFEPFDLGEVVAQARRSLGSDHPVTALLTQLERQVNEGVERVQDVFSRLLMSAGLGQMVDVVIHEIGAPIGKIGRQLVLLEREVNRSTDAKLAGSVGTMIKSIRGWLDQVHSLRQRLDPQTAGKRGRATSFTVQDEVSDTISLYETLLSSQLITVELSHSDPVRVFMSRAALGQILANLVDNAIWWLVKDRKREEGRTLRIDVEQRETGFAVIVSDNGYGVPEEDRSNIFEPYFTRKPNGMGLGLYIARLVIESYGFLVYRDDGPLPGACFEAVLERGIGQ
jgi:signal transduction histidine kinase